MMTDDSKREGAMSFEEWKRNQPSDAGRWHAEHGAKSSPQAYGDYRAEHAERPYRAKVADYQQALQSTAPGRLWLYQRKRLDGLMESYAELQGTLADTREQLANARREVVEAVREIRDAHRNPVKLRDFERFFGALDEYLRAALARFDGESDGNG